MGWWSRALRRLDDGTGRAPAAGSGSALTAPLTDERVRAWMQERQYSWFVDMDGDTGGLWRGRLFYFFTLGERHDILQVRGQWNRQFTIERLTEVLEVCNEWNTDRVWPKSYVRVRDDGAVHVLAEAATDLAAGVTDAQLGDLLGSGISSCAAFFDDLDSRYPDPAGMPA
jgi:hypothetical protein